MECLIKISRYFVHLETKDLEDDVKEEELNKGSDNKLKQEEGK